MIKNTLAIALVVVLFGTIGCSKKVKKAPAATEEKKTEQSISRQQITEIAQADENDDDYSYDEEYSDDDTEAIGTDEIDEPESTDTAGEDSETTGEDDSAYDESDYEETEDSDL